jgi:5'-3' exonuclease
MNPTFEEATTTPTFIFVDGSYFCFYRFYALINWWRNAFPDEPLEEPFKNTTFVEKFKKIFIETLRQLSKNLKLDKTINPILIVGKDCKRENIWRMDLFPQYKGNRQNDGFIGSPFFKMVYEEKLFQEGGAQAILSHPKLEADDCIAISVKYVLSKYPLCQIYIITSDKDYLQLNAHNVKLYNLAFKNIADKSSTGNSKNDLEIKIIMGDTSDNIPSVFPKCGPKTAEKCIQDPAFFKKKMSDNEAYYKQYELNSKLVNFDNIPIDLVNEFLHSIQ